MKLENLKKSMLLPKKEYIINQGMNIRGRDVHLLSFTIEKEQNRLWFMYEQDNSFEDELEDTLDEEFSNANNTNRETRLKEIEENNRDKHFHIEKLEIQGQIITFNSSSAIQAYEDNIEAIMYLQHFTEKGLIPSEWDEKKVNNLIIAQHMQSDDEAELIIDTSKTIDIRLSIAPDTKEITIGHIFKIDFGKQNTKIKYYDKDLDIEDCFYINEIYSFDPYEYIKTSVEKIEDVETRKEVFNNLTQAAKSVYTSDKNLAVIKYETKNDTQLNFYMKEFLDRYLNDISSAGSIGFMWFSKEEGLGVNGYKLRECVLQAIDKDFDGDLEIELFSRYQQIPGEEVY